MINFCMKMEEKKILYVGLEALLDVKMALKIFAPNTSEYIIVNDKSHINILALTQT